MAKKKLEPVASEAVTARFLQEIAMASLAVPLPEHDILKRAADGIVTAADEMLKAIDQLPYDHQREHATQALQRVMGFAFVIGGYGTRSDNTKSVATAAGRLAAAQRNDQRMQEAIAKHQKLLPGKRGLPKRVAKELELNEKTVRTSSQQKADSLTDCPSSARFRHF